MKRRRSLKTVWFLFIGDCLDWMDSTRADEMVAVTAVIAFILGLCTSLNFVSAMMLLVGLQLIFQAFDVRLVVQTWKRIKGGDK